ncbi:PH domain-containing protein [Hoyosella sp. G463]|uniref:PH domain-containing protein n=1 Tax=Lolliginicoccus lacisalsi TaxID=2742202 RepID=A0A927JCL7_9ACTN|nr:PH domain-containing protein [Lolliginicoccus lacisalsi]MBD8506581.1 PH domain-containing protein [Lolliginicoccus lacisalsi]
MEHSGGALGERVLLRRHPHWKMMLGPAVLTIMLTGIAGVIVGFLDARAPDGVRGIAILLVLALWALIVARRFVKPFVGWWRTALIVTSHRIAVREGLLRARGFDIPLQQVAGVRYRRGMLDRFAGTGTLLIAPIGEPPFEFAHVPEARLTHALIHHQVFGNQPVARPRRFLHAFRPR